MGRAPVLQRERRQFANVPPAGCQNGVRLPFCLRCSPHGGGRAYFGFRFHCASSLLPPLSEQLGHVRGEMSNIDPCVIGLIAFDSEG